MRQETLPQIKEIYDALESAAVDLYGFAIVCYGGGGPFAEPALLDSLLLGLENGWFTPFEGEGSLKHDAYREDFYRSIWDRARGAAGKMKIGMDVPLGHDEMAYYQLPQFARAALYLRVRRKFSYHSVAMILGTGEVVVREEVKKAREFLLGRNLKALDWVEEDF